MKLALALAPKSAAAGPHRALGVTLAGCKEPKKAVRGEGSDREAPGPVGSLSSLLSSFGTSLILDSFIREMGKTQDRPQGIIRIKDNNARELLRTVWQVASAQ